MAASRLPYGFQKPEFDSRAPWGLAKRSYMFVLPNENVQNRNIQSHFLSGETGLPETDIPRNLDWCSRRREWKLHGNMLVRVAGVYPYCFHWTLEDFIFGAGHTDNPANVAGCNHVQNHSLTYAKVLSHGWRRQRRFVSGA